MGLVVVCFGPLVQGQACVPMLPNIPGTNSPIPHHGLEYVCSIDAGNCRATSAKVVAWCVCVWIIPGISLRRPLQHNKTSHRKEVHLFTDDRKSRHAVLVLQSLLYPLISCPPKQTNKNETPHLHFRQGNPLFQEKGLAGVRRMPCSCSREAKFVYVSIPKPSMCLQ